MSDGKPTQKIGSDGVPRHPVEIWCDRWNHTLSMVRTIVGLLALIGMMLAMWFR